MVRAKGFYVNGHSFHEYGISDSSIVPSNSLKLARGADVMWSEEIVEEAFLQIPDAVYIIPENRVIGIPTLNIEEVVGKEDVEVSKSIEEVKDIKETTQEQFELSDNQKAMMKLIPAGLSEKSTTELKNAVMNNMPLDEFKALVEQRKNCG